MNYLRRALTIHFLAALVVALSARPVAGQSDAGEARTALSGGFRTLAGWLEAAAEAVPEERYEFRPVETVRSFGQIVAHVVDSHRYYCARAGGATVQYSDSVERAAPGKVELLALLRESDRDCAETIGRGDSQLAPLMEDFGHTNLHYGNIVSYMRIMGLVPPSSRGG